MPVQTDVTPAVVIRDLSFSYPTAQGPLLAGLSFSLLPGFTGIVGANGAGKTTLLQLLAGQLTADAGFIDGACDAVYCEQRTDNAPATFHAFLQDWDSGAFELRGRLGIKPDFLARWHTLSHGERKRAQIAQALWQLPSLLVIDEPTNHIDSAARELLLQNLRRFQGIGVIVSHDRELLDALCYQCVWLDAADSQVYPGGFTQANEQWQSARHTAIAERDKLSQESKRLQRELVRRRTQAQSSHNSRSKKGLSRKDHDAKEKIDRARLTDSKAGSQLRQLGGRAAKVDADYQSMHVSKQYDTGIWLPGAQSHRNQLFSVAAGELPLGDDRVLTFPALAMAPNDRVAITGCNGAGKSMLVQHLLGAVNLSAERIINMPQELSVANASRVLEDVRGLAGDALGKVMNIISRLGSRPQQLLVSRQLSPGEIRKLLLAVGMLRTPHLIVLDEPTNHLDLPSIQALENALADCPCGMLLVSHDNRFLDRLGVTRWAVKIDGQGNSQMH
jgi:macrolide transport system ATP-binding/permease protein